MIVIDQNTTSLLPQTLGREPWVVWSETSAINTAPSLVSISPAYGRPGQDIAVTMTGTYFDGNNLDVLIDDDPAPTNADIEVTSIVAVNANTITATFEIQSAATVGTYQVVIFTDDGVSIDLPFTVLPSLASGGTNLGNGQLGGYGIGPCAPVYLGD